MSKLRIREVMNRSNLSKISIIKIFLYRQKFSTLHSIMLDINKIYKDTRGQLSSKAIETGVDYLVGNKVNVALLLKRNDIITSSYNFDSIKDKTYIFDYIKSRNVLCDVICSAFLSGDYYAAETLYNKYFDSSIVDKQEKDIVIGQIDLDNEMLSMSVKRLISKFERLVLSESRKISTKDSSIKDIYSYMEHIWEIISVKYGKQDMTCLEMLLSIPQHRLEIELKETIGSTSLKNLMSLENEKWIEDFCEELAMILLIHYPYIRNYILGNISKTDLIEHCIYSLTDLWIGFGDKYEGNLAMILVELVLLGYHTKGSSKSSTIFHAYTNRTLKDKDVLTQVILKSRTDKSLLGRIFNVLISGDYDELDNIISDSNFCKEFCNYMLSLNANGYFRVVDDKDTNKLKELPISKLYEYGKYLQGDDDLKQLELNKSTKENHITRREVFEGLYNIIVSINNISSRIESYTRKEKMLERKIDSLKSGCATFNKALNCINNVDKIKAIKKAQSDIVSTIRK